MGYLRCLFDPAKAEVYAAIWYAISLIQPGINVSAEVFRVGRVKLRLIEYDYRILRKFEGRGSVASVVRHSDWCLFAARAEVFPLRFHALMPAGEPDHPLEQIEMRNEESFGLAGGFLHFRWKLRNEGGSLPRRDEHCGVGRNSRTAAWRHMPKRRS
jgi:hypothetical protein